MIIFSSQTICQAISCAVRDFASEKRHAEGRSLRNFLKCRQVVIS